MFCLRTRLVGFAIVAVVLGGLVAFAHAQTNCTTSCYTIGMFTYCTTTCF